MHQRKLAFLYLIDPKDREDRIVNIKKFGGNTIFAYVDINLYALGDKDWHSGQLNEILEEKTIKFL